MFVGTVLGGGVIYKFDMSPSRKTLGLFDGPLADGVADNTGGLLDEQADILWGTEFGVVSDILSGPGGMYVTSLSNGVLYRITTDLGAMAPVAAVPEPPPLLLMTLLSGFVLRRSPRRHVRII